MNDTDADHFAREMKQTWSGGPTQRVWCQIAADLDRGPARTALHDLRRTMHQSPTPAHLFDAYRDAQAAAARAAGDNYRADPCGLCSDTGWVDAADQARPNSTAVKTCSCTIGLEQRSVHKRILSANGTHRNPEHAAADDHQQNLLTDDQLFEPPQADLEAEPER